MNAVKFPRALIALSLLAAFGSTPASALSVVYSLNQTNIDAGAFLDGTNYLEVTITSTVAGTASFSVAPVYAFSTLTNFGIQSFGFNYTDSNTLNISPPSGWTVNPPPPSNQDGFGGFDYVVGTTGAGRLSPLTFTVSGLTGATVAATLGQFVKNSAPVAGQGNQYFAAHLTDFTTGLTDANGAITSGYFGGSAPVPEPETYAMLLAGLGLVGFAARRKLS
jgi:hypothetical protein